MGQKLEKPSEKDEESRNNSECSEQTGVTEQPETREQGESRDEDDDGRFGRISRISISGSPAGHTGELTVNPARTDNQTGQPIRPLCQPEHPLNTTDKWVGGDRESLSVTRTVEDSKTVLNRKEARQTSNKNRGSESKAAVFTWTTAMEGQGYGMKSETGCSKLGPDIKSRGLSGSFDPRNEEDFVVLERDETWTSFDGESNLSGNMITRKNLQSSAKGRVEEDTSAPYLPKPSRNTPQEKVYESKSRRLSDTLLVMPDTEETCAGSSPTACLQSERGQHLAEVTGSRCRLKGVVHVGAAHTEATGRGKAEREQVMKDQREGQVATHQSKQNNGTGGLESMRDTEGCFVTQEEEHGENLGFIAQNVDQSNQNRFAGAVSKRARAGIISSSGKKDDGQAFDSRTTNANPPRSERTQARDNPSLSMDVLSPGSEGYDGKMQKVISKTENEHVRLSAVITPPPQTHLLPKKDTKVTTQLDREQIVPEAVPTGDSKDEPMPKEKLRVKGPPPPVPKKPKNPFIKLKTAQLLSTDVQRRGRDHRSEEKVKRRHTFHFNKDLRCNTAKNQDMCMLWDDRGPYIPPTNTRRLSADLGPCQRLSLGRMDEQYGDMIDYDFCERMANLSPDEDMQDLDMLQRRIFFERRSRNKSSPPPVAKKAQNPSASTEALHITEVARDLEIQRLKSACLRKREICPEPPTEIISNNSHANYGKCRDVTDHRADRDSGSEVDSYKPVSKLIKEKNQMQRLQGRVKSEAVKPEVRAPEQGPSVKVSQMKTAFDVPKRSKERQAEVQPSPKKGSCLGQEHSEKP
uniref:uncharacterized protein LOC122784522 n=1 Tax=Solea senegalensis TaxID=28829 RepID=UPI001CD91512|nr:uncharacterized protein LOC122784522 [Solea senegalensis]